LHGYPSERERTGQAHGKDRRGASVYLWVAVQCTFYRGAVARAHRTSSGTVQEGASQQACSLELALPAHPHSRAWHGMASSYISLQSTCKDTHHLGGPPCVLHSNPVPAADWCLHAPPQSRLHHPRAFVPVPTLLHCADPTPVLTLSRRCRRGPAQARQRCRAGRSCTRAPVLSLLSFHPTTPPPYLVALPPYHPPPINTCVHPCTDIPSLCWPSAIL
jgi:hypothetical protein